MALDGITVAALQRELSNKLTDGYISKIIQPEKDELQLTIKTQQGNLILLLSADPSLPLAYLTTQPKQAPKTAPSFCMLLRKHLSGGRILEISQPSLERILDITVLHRNEMGDLTRRHLMIEIMGKHSNIILCDEELVILDSIKKISANISSLREVLPGRAYIIPKTADKLDPFTADQSAFLQKLTEQSRPLGKAFYLSLTGLSPVMGEELCLLAGISPETDAQSLDETAGTHLFHVFSNLVKDIKNGEFAAYIWYKNDSPCEFAAIELSLFRELEGVCFDSISHMLETYFAEKNTAARMKQKSADLRKIVSTLLERAVKKLNLQQKQLHDTKDRDKYRIYGEMLHTFGYQLEEGADHLDVINYYDDQEMTIPLDPTKTPAENAQHYYHKYNKAKRTYEALTVQIEETRSEIDRLESIRYAISASACEEDLFEIFAELRAADFIKKGKRNEKCKKAKPLHFISCDGFDIYVGKNNYQNDYITFQLAEGGDWWFHAKKIHGSHVILKSGNRQPSDEAFEEAARLAALYSQAGTAEKVEIDYIQKKHVKKPAGGAPGFVIYHTNYSMVSTPGSLPKQLL